jgi:hypothetical protein
MVGARGEGLTVVTIAWVRGKRRWGCRRGGGHGWRGHDRGGGVMVSRTRGHKDLCLEGKLAWTHSKWWVVRTRAMCLRQWVILVHVCALVQCSAHRSISGGVLQLVSSCVVRRKNLSLSYLKREILHWRIPSSLKRESHIRLGQRTRSPYLCVVVPLIWHCPACRFL